MSLSVGARLGPYEIVSPIGAGGMGEVYRGRDTRLDRPVAIKVVSSTMAGDPQWRERFDREARAISRLNHPHICTLHDVGHQDGIDYLVMEYLEGETLADRLRRGALPLQEVLRVALQLADALAEAQRHGLIHRDIKPANIFLTTRGDAKILDFGLAKTAARDGASSGAGPTVARLDTLTGAGTPVGTVAYMSPEQTRGLPVDHRTDLFSLGVVLYEMVTHERPFTGSYAVAVADAILHEEPREFGDTPVPGPLKSLIRKLLEKDPGNRHGSARDVYAELKVLETSLVPARRAQLSKVAWVAVAVAIVLVIAVAAQFWQRWSRERWALQTAAPEIARLVDAGEYVKAAALVRDARDVLPKDPTIESLWMRATVSLSLASVPPEADVSIRPYRGDPNDWQNLGKTPLKDVRVARNDYVWRVAKPGFAPTVFIGTGGQNRSLNLAPEHTVPAGMVVVEGRATVLQWPFGLANQVQLDDFLIDRHEVTNEEYKKFVDAGGYEKREFWLEPFVKDGKTIPWEQAIASFRDTTGRPGPATWEVGSYPKGLEKHPVAGVSWYEAAAFAQFAGKSLPTVYHWMNASQAVNFARLIAPASNFSRTGTVPVGRAGALSGFDTTDMAGNVKEWCSNEEAEGNRFILGGGFGEADYLFNFMDAQSVWERRANYGFRGVKLASSPSPAASAKLERVFRDVWKDVSDDVFAAYKGLYAYDKTDLNARVEETQATDNWRRHKVSFDAAYGHERVTAHLFLPKNVAPPFQTVVFFPGGGALLQDRFDPSIFVDGSWDFLLKSERAVMVPIYKGTYERRDDVTPGGPGGNPPALWRDHVIAWSRDLSRSLDYLETRQDVDRTKTAYFGFSFGGVVAPVLLAIEGRFKAAILSSGGSHFQRALPEADGLNFVTRVKIPVLMLNGRYDSYFPVESSQLPIFNRLGTPAGDKRHVIYEAAGHGGLPYAEEVRESLDWLDKYLGPVRH